MYPASDLILDLYVAVSTATSNLPGSSVPSWAGRDMLGNVHRRLWIFSDGVFRVSGLYSEYTATHVFLSHLFGSELPVNSAYSICARILSASFPAQAMSVKTSPSSPGFRETNSRRSLISRSRRLSMI